MTADVKFAVDGCMGRITLDRPKALNALTLPMVQAIEAQLTAWESDDAIRLVLVDGAGERGLCAGGDIRLLYDAAVSGDISTPKLFFREEYRMNAQIAVYPKPYVAFMDGIVMGGGIGISAHGSHRVVTERSRLAMPETGIGFVVDVGGTWLLGRAPDQMGIHAALTSAQLGAEDAIACGLADRCVASATLPALATALSACGTADEVSACIATHATAPPPGRLQEGWIGRCYIGDDVEAIVAALDQDPSADARQAARDIAGKSPTSLKVTLRALRSAPSLGSLAAALEQEYRLVLHSVQTADFREGVRAAVVDKDRNPSWSPSRLADVSHDSVEAFFSAPDYGGLGLQR